MPTPPYYDLAFDRFCQIEQEHASRNLHLNEAQTRFEIIDVILGECLNWKHNGLVVEEKNEAGFSDYILGSPAKCILEAKREGVLFEIPNTDARPDQIINIQAIIKGNKNLESALCQAQRYCAARGVQFGVVSNGHQFIGFLANRLDGVPPLDGKCIAFRSLTQIKNNFPLFWKLFSFDGIVAANLLNRLLEIESPPPGKISRSIPGYPKAKESDDIQTTLRQLSELVLQDLIDSSELEEDFFRECYCASGPLSQFSLLAKNIMQARYDSLFLEDGNRPTPVPVNKKKRGAKDFEHDIIAEATAKRPIVLIGDVGVGKTSFIKNLIYNEALEHFRNSLYIYIDLGSRATLTDNFRGYVLNAISSELGKVNPDGIANIKFLTQIYGKAIREFEQGPNGLLKDINPPEYQRRYADFLLGKVQDQGSHLKECIQHISKQYNRDVIVFIDNADQRDFETQQNAFLVAQEIANDWKALVFVAVRPSTFFKSRRSGALSAYPHKVFTISPPKLEDALISRLAFALSIVNGKRRIETIKNISISVSSLATILNVMTNSIKSNSDLLSLITNVSGGNVRESVGLIVKYIGSPNVDAFKMLKEIEEGNNYIIPEHEMSKAIILGDYEQFNPESTIAMNVFDTPFCDPKGHFISLAALSILQNNDSLKDSNGYILTSKVVNILQEIAGFTEKQIEANIKNCVNKKLIEETRRITQEEAIEICNNDRLPEKIRITSSGAYHFIKWCASFSYMEAMSIDTPIFEDDVREKISSVLGNGLFDRYKRAVVFRDYLLRQWAMAPALKGIFNFEELVKNNSNTFAGVENALIRLGRV